MQFRAKSAACRLHGIDRVSQLRKALLPEGYFLTKTKVHCNADYRNLEYPSCEKLMKMNELFQALLVTGDFMQILR